MNQYKKPKTRIKAITGKDGVTRYYAEYTLGFFWGWQFTRPSITSSDYVFTLEDAQSRIDDFLKRQETGQAEPKKSRVEYIKYPENV